MGQESVVRDHDQVSGVTGQRSRVTDQRSYYIFVCNISMAKKCLMFVCNKCSNIIHLLYYKNF